MNKRFVAAAAGLALGAAAFVGGTGANFTGHAVDGQNSVTAGTLGIIVVGNPDAQYVPFSVTNAKPGDSSYVPGDHPTQCTAGLNCMSTTRMVQVHNTGTLPGTVKVRVVRDSVPNALSNEMLLAIDGIGGTYSMLDKSVDYLNVQGDTLDTYPPLPGGGDRWYSVDYTIPTSAGNEIQGLGVAWHLEFTIEQ